MNQIAGFDIVFLIANGFGLLSTLCFIISFQIKSNKKLYVVQSIANIFYGIQFYLLGAYGGLFNMAMQIFRNLLLCKRMTGNGCNGRGWPRCSVCRA